MNLKKFTLFLFSCLFSVSTVFAQRDTIGIKTIVTKTSQYINAFPFEKVYLHLDKPYYTAGDTIWFKAYVTIDKHQPTVLSNIVYVDIANDKDSIIKVLKMPVVNGTAHGNIFLPAETYRQGNYHLRGYTQYMRNYDPDYYFNKNITIGNSIIEGINTGITFKNTGKPIAVIAYKETGGAGLANRRVNWSIANANGDEVAKGKATTDANGNITVPLSEAANTNLQKATLIANLETPGKKEKLDRFPLQGAAEQHDVQFFPEGGELTLGVESKIAFKAINANGLGTNIKGVVIDNTGTTVAQLQSQHAGMGVFTLTPQDGKTYKANITFSDGSTASYDMPRIKPSGISLAVNNFDPNNVNIKLTANQAYFAANQGKMYYVLAQNGGAVYFAAQTALTQETFTSSIPRDKFPTGVIQFSLMSERGVILAERVIFVQRNDALNIALNSDKKTYGARQKVHLQVAAKKGAAPVAGDFSISVIDESKVPYDEDNETTILSNLLLTSELKGNVEKPNYYFLTKNANAAADLDVLMLTQGYRRISYRNVILNKVPQIVLQPEQNGLEITGMLRNNTGMPISRGNLRLQIPSKRFFTETMTDMEGNFKVSKLDFADSAEIVLNARGNVNSRNLVISVNGDPYQPATKNIYNLDEIMNIDSAFKPLLVNSKRQYDNTHTLKEVTIKAKPMVKKPSYKDYSMLSGLPAMSDQSLTGERFQDCPNLYVCLPANLLGVTAEDNNLYFSKNISNSNKLPIQVFVDGKVVDYGYLNSIAGRDVEVIDVFKSDGVSSINRTYQSDGIISIITKKKPKGERITLQQLQDMIPKGNVLTYNGFGYAVAKEFYSPKYDALKQGAFGGDLRSTIYWSPKVRTDKVTGTTSVDFFNADGRGTYRATIEGFDADGNLGRYIYRYTVK
ncbi:carboxypeptidase regulatory-like domain-containing protein [Mucilaginibacter achroorhodeus]|uniref:Carboxypeptidase regulatory-like domain-containing protein n=1 Tax=Mucilaginibacter achroorhodeus TaxID=2599294 RepID=A0A563U1Y7_9SPHI|nr:carboxypeptidase regulatory-like domain-containing protein [Mucilaginibacter achroorhodeus]TWR25530.1 carboxypeptidase regulatory-like domain-containing protein [Mucilaginibacter achroorhodeus]